MKISNELKVRKLINKNFLIRVTFINKTAISFDEEFAFDCPVIKMKSKLIGGGQYHKIVGRELADKHFKKVLSCGLDKYTFKLRGSRRVDFVSK